jgi:hypothetical protein
MDLALPIVVSALSLAFGVIGASGHTPASAFKRLISFNSNSSAQNNGRPSFTSAPSQMTSAPVAAPPPPPPLPPPPPPSQPPKSNNSRNSGGKNTSGAKNSGNNKNAGRNSGAKDDDRKPFVPYPPKGNNAGGKPNNDAAKQRNNAGNDMMDGDMMDGDGDSNSFPPRKKEFDD